MNAEDKVDVDPRRDPSPESVEEYDERRAAEVEKRTSAYLDLLRRWQRGRGPADRPGGEDEQDGRVPPVTPFLLIRHAITDLGARPIPPGVPFWVSPDIWVQSSDPSGNPVAGEPNTVVARVFNLGAFQAIPVQVDFFWADPSLGLTPASMNPIGTAWADVPSLSSIEVACPVPWVPTVVNNGHECVMVNCSNWLADPIISPFNPVSDRHVGQRNLHVVSPPRAAETTFSLRLTNAFPFALQASVDVRAQRLALTGEHPSGELLAQAAAFAAADRLTPAALLKQHQPGTLGHEIAAAALRRARRHPAKQKEPAFIDRPDDRLGELIKVKRTERRGELESGVDEQFASRVLKNGARAPQTRLSLLTVELEPGTFETIDVVVGGPDDLQDDELVVFHLQQRVGHVVLGGYTIVVYSG